MHHMQPHVTTDQREVNQAGAKQANSSYGAPRGRASHMIDRCIMAGCDADLASCKTQESIAQHNRITIKGPASLQYIISHESAR